MCRGDVTPKQNLLGLGSYEAAVLAVNLRYFMLICTKPALQIYRGK